MFNILLNPLVNNCGLQIPRFFVVLRFTFHFSFSFLCNQCKELLFIYLLLKVCVFSFCIANDNFRVKNRRNVNNSLNFRFGLSGNKGRESIKNEQNCFHSLLNKKYIWKSKVLHECAP